MSSGNSPRTRCGASNSRSTSKTIHTFKLAPKERMCMLTVRLSRNNCGDWRNKLGEHYVYPGRMFTEGTALFSAWSPN